MTNDNILLQLKENYGNAQSVKKYLSRWNKDESEFPMNDVFTYIQMNTWEYEDFSLRVENIIRQVLPDYMLDVFFRMKQFKSNSRNEMLPNEETYGKVMGYPFKTQDDKAFTIYRFAVSDYYERSILKGKESINEQDLYIN